MKINMIRDANEFIEEYLEFSEDKEDKEIKK